MSIAPVPLLDAQKLRITNGMRAARRFGSGSGTLAVVPGEGSGSPRVLSCAHVLASGFNPAVGDEVVLGDESLSVEGAQPRMIGVLGEFTPLSDGVRIRTDLAVVTELRPDVTADARWPGGLTVRGTVAPREGIGAFRIFGCRTQSTAGVCTKTASVRVVAEGVGFLRILEGYVLEGPGRIVEPGDSGAGVADEQDRFIGMVVALLSPSRAVMVGWPAIEAALVAGL